MRKEVGAPNIQYGRIADKRLHIPLCLLKVNGVKAVAEHLLDFCQRAINIICNVAGVDQPLAQMHPVDGRAFRQIYPLPSQPVPQTQERTPKALEERHAVYSEMLSFLTLSDKHRENLLERGLSDERIERNGYRSMPETPQARRLLAKLVGSSHDLLGIPGFYTRDAQWTVAGPNGFLIPVRNQDGLIQGLKIRLDDADKPGRKYRWLSSRDRHLENGTRSYSWIHVTGDRSRKRAFLTEGPLKGDVASFLANDALFICTGGVNAIKGLRDWMGVPNYIKEDGRLLADLIEMQLQALVCAYEVEAFNEKECILVIDRSGLEITGTKDLPEAHVAMWYGMSKTLINAQWACWEEDSPAKKLRIKIAKRIDKFA